MRSLPMTQNNSDTLRQRLKTARSNISVAARQHGSLLMRARLFTWLAIAIDDAQAAEQPCPGAIAAFWPLSDEPDLRPLMSQWDESGIIVLLPVMTGPDQPLTFHRWRSDTVLLKGPFGVQEPPADDPYQPDVVLVPTLGYTSHGNRMGYGQGYYDRTLAHLASTGVPPVSIGVAWHEGDIERLEPDYRPATHDYRLDAIMTPQGWATEAPTYPAPSRCSLGR